MQSAVTLTETKHFIQCPHCPTGRFDYTHFVTLNKTTRFGPWYCPECGSAICGEYQFDGEVSVEPYKPEERHVPALVLVRLNAPTPKPIHVVFEHHWVTGGNDEIGTNHRHACYWVNEHTCPVNWLRLPVLEGDDTDPHGIFEFIEIVKKPAEWDWSGFDSIEQYKQLFQRLQLSNDEPELPSIDELYPEPPMDPNDPNVMVIDVYVPVQVPVQFIKLDTSITKAPKDLF